MTPAVRLVAIGPPLALVDDDAAAVATALAAGGIGVESRTLVDEDEPALERALTPATTLTVILAGPGGSTGDVVRHRGCLCERYDIDHHLIDDLDDGWVFRGALRRHHLLS